MDFGQYELTPQDHQQAFQELNPQMRPEYNQAFPSWVQRLKQRLAQGGQAMQGALAGPQQQMQQPQQQMEDPMAQKGRALQDQYNRGSQMGQAARNIYGMFGGG